MCQHAARLGPNPEIDLMSEFMEESAFTTKGPLVALRQFVEIANYFAKAKIKTRA